MTIERLFRDLNKLDSYIDLMAKENDDLSNTLLMKNEMNKQYLSLIDKLKRQTEVTNDRVSYLELKSKNSEVVANFSANTDKVLNVTVNGTELPKDDQQFGKERMSMSSQTR